MVPEDFSQLKLAPGFLLSLSVLDDSDFNGNFRVDPDGNIALPILGLIHVDGETSTAARDQIRKKLLDDQILKDPQVELSVLEYTAPRVTIMGEVQRPGKYPLLAPRKLVDVLALAGGPTMLAGNEIQILSGASGSEERLVHLAKDSNPKSAENVIVHPGDTVQVKRAGIVYILGAVNRPGGYVMQEDGTLNLLQAIALALGTSRSASTKTIYLLRRNPDGSETDISVPYRKITQGKLGEILLHATDVLYIPSSPLKSIFGSSQTILSTVGSAAIYKF